MPSTVEDSNPFEDLLENNNLPDAAIPPALPPLPIQEQQEYQAMAAAAQEIGGGEFVVLPEGGSATAAPAVNSEMATPTMPTKVTKSYKSTLLFKTDLTKAARDIHPCGILHFTRTSPGRSEEHAFAWIQHHTVPTHVASILGHMHKFGFDPKDVTFIPYSSRRSWIEKYPLAFPHVHCGDNGVVTGFPYWSAEACSTTGDIAAGRMMMLTDNSGGLAAVDGSLATPVVQRGRKKKKIFPTAHLANDERDELHIEIFKYFQWLQNSMAANVHPGVDGVAEAGGGLDDGDDDGNKKLPAQFTLHGGGATAGIDPSSLQNVLDTLSSTFKVVRNSHTGSSYGHSMPFLEEALSDPLSKLAAAAKRDPQARASRTKRSRGLDFDDMYSRLIRFQQIHGHVNVPQKYAQDGQLGSWVANIRSKRKQMAKRGEEFEIDFADDEISSAGEDDGAEGPTKKRKRSGGRQKLTQERIHRLDGIGFQWVVANPNTKSWEERFEDLKEYQQLHGTTRVPRSSGTLGEWVHMQRRLYNKKDKNFMAKKAPLMDEIGFEWQPRKHALVSWEDNFNRLVDFGRLNRHYNVSSPFPEGYVGDFEDQNEEVVEAHRFSKWVKRIHAEYRAYAQGKGSRMLNDARVMQLREIGFQFA